jgi:ERCC4-type nuclease
MPKRRASEQTGLVIVADSRERYAYRFADQQAEVERGTLRGGDYAVVDDSGDIIAAVERKRFENFVSAIVDGSLLFQLAELSELQRAAVVVEGRYEDLLRLKHTQPGWVMDLVARVQVRYPAVPIVFAGSRKHAEEYTYRFLRAARAELDPR